MIQGLSGHIPRLISFVKASDSSSTWYLAALREAARNPDGYMSKMCNFLPIKVVSYMMLPCTLPLESAIAVVQR